MTEQLPLHGIAVYNPGILSDEELKRYFVARLPLLEHLLDGLRREEPGKSPQHRLIVGTRGMGKTTLLHRLALAIEEDDGLSKAWLPLNFPEEQYNIARLSDLWVNCLDALADTLEQAGKETLFSELDRTIDNLPDEEQKRAGAALENLLGFAERLGKRLLLLIDNLDIVLDRLSDDHWTIRKVLGHEPRLLLIGASARVLEATYEYEAAFYDFFKIHELKGLGEDEMRQVLLRLAEADNNPGIARLIGEEPARLRTLHTLTGGNPRTAVLLYGVLAQGMEGDVRSDLERLLDHCTPLYKSRFEELSPQAQKIVDAMAIFWDPLTAGLLADQVRLPVNSVSTQLTRLEQQGVVEKVAIRPGRKSGFQIAERFFNIWYLMRTSRRVRRRLVWLVQFLKVFYSQEELQQRARRHLLGREVEDEQGTGLRRAEYAFSLARALEDGAMRSALECSALQSMIGDLPGAIEAYRKQLEVKPDDESAWNNLGNALADHGDLPGAIEAYRQGTECDSSKGVCHNGLAWLYFEQNDRLDEAESLAREAVALDPDALDYRHTLACILVRNGKWTDARQAALRFLRADDGDWLDRVWNDILQFFREALKQGLAEEAVRLLEEAGLSERWRPLHTALKAFATGDEWLTRVAPEVRQPAEALMEILKSGDTAGP
jgi:tetratricopeptide (TPR) repeat protein